MKRPIIRFTIRAVLIGATVISVYFATWPLTRTLGVPSRSKDWSKSAISTEKTLIERATSPAPLIIRQDEVEYNVRTDTDVFTAEFPRRYYLWVFGLKVQLPIEGSWRPFGSPVVLRITSWRKVLFWACGIAVGAALTVRLVRYRKELLRNR